MKFKHYQVTYELLDSMTGTISIHQNHIHCSEFDLDESIVHLMQTFYKFQEEAIDLVEKTAESNKLFCTFKEALELTQDTALELTHTLWEGIERGYNQFMLLEDNVLSAKAMDAASAYECYELRDCIEELSKGQIIGLIHKAEPYLFNIMEK
mgnify:CR=1 FL=1